MSSCTRARRILQLLAAAGALLTLAGCLDYEQAPGEDGEGARGSALTFIAQQREFAHFEDWTAFETEVRAEHAGMSGTITEYLNKLPEPGDDRFPIGTMIVKTVVPDQGPAGAIHAMVKRGGAFNPRGAVGWEFFELQKNAKGTPIIAWRGAKPPNGERYKNLLNPDADMLEADCNGCHKVAENDAVLSQTLQLDALE